jgi:hypothetical protein
MGETPSRPLERQLVSMFAANREDAFETQRARASALMGVARMLHEKFGLQKWANLGAKHVAFVIETWKAENTGRRSIENKLTQLRWLVRKIGKANLVPRSNRELGIEPGPRYTRAGKTISDERLAEILAAVTEPRLRMAILLARYVGMRFKEAMLFRPWIAWDNERVWLKRGTKGGRPRYLYLYCSKQREVLAQARALVSGDSSLVPPEAPTFEKWRQHCYHLLRKAGIGRKQDRIFHDLRRGYVIERMDYLVRVRRMSPDAAARLVAREVGHNRVDVLRWYLSEFPQTAAAVGA